MDMYKWTKQHIYTYIYKLATEGAYYFFSRPRRSGKSLLFSMMEAYFNELFEGLAIEQLKSYKWEDTHKNGHKLL